MLWLKSKYKNNTNKNNNEINSNMQIDWLKVIVVLLLIILSCSITKEWTKLNLKEHYKESMMELCKYEAFANDVKGFMYDSEKEECTFIYD